MRTARLRDLPYDLVVAAAPHPDDSAIGCGGLLYRLGRESEGVSRRVVTLALTSGYRGVADEYLARFLGEQGIKLDPVSDPQAAIDQKALIRKDEIEQESRILGVSEAVFLDLRKLYETNQIVDSERKAVVAALDRLQAAHRPQRKLLLMPRLADPHPVHSASARILGQVLAGRPGWEVWHYETPWMPLDPREIDVVVVLEERHVSVKVTAMYQHRSQIERTDFAKVVRDLAELKAQVLPELVFGFGEAAAPLGQFVEVFQIRREPLVLR